MHTEDEARKRWCPMARVPDGNGGSNGALTATNRHAGTKTGKDGKPRILRGNALCIASECMWWRWEATRVKPEVPKGFCGVAPDA